MKIRHTQQAFTLLEMAIVLVIVAFIIGAIFMGTNIKHNTELESVVADVARYQKAVLMFKDKYGELPGDLPNASSLWAGAGNGDGNGVIDVGGNNNYPFSAGGGETYLVWQHLGDAKMIDSNYTGVVDPHAYAGVPGWNIPASRIGGNGFSLYSSAVTSFITGNNWGITNLGHVLVYGNFGGTSLGAGLSADEAADIDRKLDDGVPSTGNVLSFHGALTGCYAASGTTYSYNSANQGLQCALIFVTGF